MRGEHGSKQTYLCPHSQSTSVSVSVRLPVGGVAVAGGRGNGYAFDISSGDCLKLRALAKDLI